MPPAPELPVPGETDAFLEFDKKVTPETDANLRASRATGLSAAKSRLSMVTAEEVNRMAYMEMRTSLYLVGTLSFYAIILGGSIVIPDVAIIFDFAAAFAVSAIAFVFPGVFYLKGSKRFGGGNKFYTRMAYLYIVIGCFNCVLGSTSTVLNIVYG